MSRHHKILCCHVNNMTVDVMFQHAAVVTHSLLFRCIQPLNMPTADH